MTDVDLRDYFAGKAIEGGLGALWSREWERSENTTRLAAMAYAIADAMLAERQKPVVPAPAKGEHPSGVTRPALDGSTQP